ncbi:MAG: hypothetical protein IPL71_22950 [Anaerolineales bacterium]|uniref:hypothetical protein n=1 Tax=Candidatus Villigracilis proximus TaxID=3140683 RepID=UPI00313541E7|nr:hypothetical protein [Anaerolineales bacterium]
MYIVFNSLRNDDQADLYIVDGSNQVQLTNHPEPDWVRGGGVKLTDEEMHFGRNQLSAARSVKRNFIKTRR